MISFIYFDVGGVVTRDFSVTGLWDEVKKEIGIPHDRFDDFEKFWKKYRREICIGRDVDSLMPLISHEFNITIPKEYSFLNDGFVKRFAPNTAIYPVLKKAREKYRIGLLTDMYKSMFAAISERKLLPDIVFDVLVDSSVVGYKKPDREIFEIAEKMTGLRGQEILFIENTKAYVEAAREYGWQTFWYDSSDYDKSSHKLDKFLSGII